MTREMRTNQTISSLALVFQLDSTIWFFSLGEHSLTILKELEHSRLNGETIIRISVLSQTM